MVSFHLRESKLSIQKEIIIAFPISGGLAVSKPAKNTKPHLLTPEEGCGLSNVPQKRIMGGTIAKDGKRLIYLLYISLFRNEYHQLLFKSQN